MSFTIITGPRGSGKTSRLLHLADTFNKRILLHNIDGLDSKKGDHVLQVSPLSFCGPSDYFRIETYDKSSLYHGNVFILDDFQFFYHDFLRGHEVEVNKFFDNHCAYGVDIFITVQDILLIPSALLPDVFMMESFGFSRFLHLFGFTPFSVSLYRRFSSGGYRRMSKRNRLYKNKYFRLSPEAAENACLSQDEED